MELKEDLEEAKERLNAWWDHEIIGRPILSYYIPKRRGAIGGYLDARCQDWTLAKNHEDIEKALNGFEKRANQTYFGGEAIPTYHPNYGPGIAAAVLGVEPKFESETVWFNCPIEVKDIVSFLEGIKLNNNNEWYSLLLKVTEYAAKRAKGSYFIAMTDIGGVLDILSFFLGPTQILLTMKRKPEIIDTCRAIILEKILRIYDKLQTIIEKYVDGCNAWLNIWCKRRWYPVQCDFIAMLNPKWFERFALPDIITQIDHLDYAIYHMDGPYQIPYLDTYLAIENLTGIQWVPGAGRALQGSAEWMPLYKKIQKAGKNMIIDTLPEFVPHIYNMLDPKGLYVRTFYSSQIAADYYLPKFLGGKDGIIINDAVKWTKSNNKLKLEMEDFNLFLKTQNILLENKIKNMLLKEINIVLKGVLYDTFS
jgi:hypothetical protein